jgi:hypothetical protein
VFLRLGVSSLGLLLEKLNPDQSLGNIRRQIMPIDYSKYPENWKTEIVPRILKRAGNRCEVCGLKNRQSVYSAKIKAMNGNGRYGYFQIWFSNESDTIRIDNLMIG